ASEVGDGIRDWSRRWRIESNWIHDFALSSLIMLYSQEIFSLSLVEEHLVVRKAGGLDIRIESAWVSALEMHFHRLVDAWESETPLDTKAKAFSFGWNFEESHSDQLSITFHPVVVEGVFDPFRQKREDFKNL